LAPSGSGPRAERTSETDANAPEIRLRGVRTHNLQGLDLDLPRNRLLVLAGVSGSGKSSLAFDTLHAEGQRRYVETFSAQARQFLEQLEKPEADLIAGVPPSIAVAQRAGRASDAGTLGTATEIHAYLAVLFARLGQVECLDCGAVVRPADVASIAAEIARWPEGTRYQVGFPIDLAEETDLEALAEALRADGFLRVRIGGQTASIEFGPIPQVESETSGLHSLDVIVDRLIRGREAPGRLEGSIETALERGVNCCRILTDDRAFTFERDWICARCGRRHMAPEPRLFHLAPIEGAAIDGSLPLRERLRPEALAVRIQGLDLPGLEGQPVVEAIEAVRRFRAAAVAEAVERRVIAPVIERLGVLERIGLGYLSLDRPTSTLSAGEARRAALTRALGSGLVNSLYVFDEPSIGLHPEDAETLVQSLIELRDRGNTVVVVDHEERMIRAADQVIEIGPGSGPEGGRLVYQGPPEGLANVEASPTGAFFFRGAAVSETLPSRPPDDGWLVLEGASGHNLKGIDAAFPIGRFCVVAGRSGSGKSSLVEETLHPAVANLREAAALPNLPFRGLRGAEGLAGSTLVDAAPIGRSGRSNPATYLGVFDEIRKTFASTHEAKARGYKPGRFSFNVAGGRCDACEGNGHQVIDMQFLADIVIRCPECSGTRYRSETLEVTYRGKSIAEVLELTVREAFGFFKNRPKAQARLRPLLDVGLDYLRLGQPAGTLSGGEAQRLKLAAHLPTSAASVSRKAGEPGRLFVIDEPTTGLHPADVALLAERLRSLADLGHTLVVIEHDPSLMLQADWILELGPGAGAAGGRIVSEGPPEAIAQRDTPTGRALRRRLL